MPDRIGSAVLGQGASRVGQDMLLIVDPTDMRKKYARKMEYLATVRDAGGKECGLGYRVDTVVGAENGSSEIVRLVTRLYSQGGDDFVSENEELLDVMGREYQTTSRRGIFVIDRGGDRRRLHKGLLTEENQFRFIMRRRGDRDLLYRRKLRETLQLAQRCTTPYGRR